MQGTKGYGRQAFDPQDAIEGATLVKARRRADHFGGELAWGRGNGIDLDATFPDGTPIYHAAIVRSAGIIRIALGSSSQAAMEMLLG